jgi:hypothetical protein
MGLYLVGVLILVLDRKLIVMQVFHLILDLVLVIRRIIIIRKHGRNTWENSKIIGAD